MTKIIYSIRELNSLLKKEKPSHVCIVTTSTLRKRLSWAIREIRSPRISIALVPGGEKAKEWDAIEKLLKKFSALGLDRNSAVIALGGGSVGDSVGFATSIYLRGLKLVQVPTTLLSQVDSAHGGKTAINFLGSKNQIGTFYEPVATVLDSRFLSSLPEEQIVCGLGEIIKAGLIRDPSILTLLQKETVTSLPTSKNLPLLVKKAVVAKYSFISKDFKDAGIRQILNAGHTIGHAIELKYGVSHGRAVLIGLLQELAWTESLGYTDPAVRKNLLSLLDNLGIHIDTSMKASWKELSHDKKILGKEIVFPIIEREGVAKLVTISLAELPKAFV